MTASIRTVSFGQNRSLTGHFLGLLESPVALVTLELESPLGKSGIYEMAPQKARGLAKQLTALADLLDPPPSPEAAVRAQVGDFVDGLPGRPFMGDGRVP